MQGAESPRFESYYQLNLSQSCQDYTFCAITLAIMKAADRSVDLGGIWVSPGTWRQPLSVQGKARQLLPQFPPVPIRSGLLSPAFWETTAPNTPRLERNGRHGPASGSHFLVPVAEKAPVAERRGRDVVPTPGPNTLRGSDGILCLVFGAAQPAFPSKCCKTDSLTLLLAHRSPNQTLHWRSDAGSAMPVPTVTASQGEKRGLFHSPPSQGEEARGDAAFLQPPLGHRGCLSSAAAARKAIAGGPGARRGGKAGTSSGNAAAPAGWGCPAAGCPRRGSSRLEVPVCWAPFRTVLAHAQTYSVSAPSFSF